MAKPKAGQRFKPERIILTEAIYSILSDLLEEGCVCISQIEHGTRWPSTALLINGRKLTSKSVEKLVNAGILEWKEGKAKLTIQGRIQLETGNRIGIDRRRKNSNEKTNHNHDGCKS